MEISSILVIKVTGSRVIKVSGYPVIKVTGSRVIKVTGSHVIKVSGYPVTKLFCMMLPRLAFRYFSRACALEVPPPGDPSAPPTSPMTYPMTSTHTLPWLSVSDQFFKSSPNQMRSSMCG
ncbi:hypothetical protein OS493_029658 [Desmophyllum pertusum]|uniref:Uncharacterized protein n=1 Tax=Desmophyllum pertusum TaxID=174260 RepID=A0A9W9ZK82_9CNID|nr:hypothetical protein OS493_029658 [Desmophyllum pertusum]